MPTVEYDYFHYIGPGMFGTHDYNDETLTYDSLVWTVHYYTLILNLPKTGIIHDIGFYVYGREVGDIDRQYEVALKTIDSEGEATTTNYGGSSGTIVNSISDLDVGWNWVELSQPATGTVGNFVAASLKRISANGVSGSLQVPTEVFGFNAFPSSKLSTSVDGLVDSSQSLMAIRYSDDFVFGLPANKFYAYIGDLNDNPDEFGAVFSVPLRTECVGARLPYNILNGINVGVDVLLYDSDSVLLTSCSITNEEYLYGDYLAAERTVCDVRFSPVWLSAGETYRLAIRSQSTTWPAYSSGVELITGAYAYCLPEGERWKATYRNNTGTWTDVDGRIPSIAIIADKISYDTSGGSTGTTTVVLSGEGSYGWAS